jgi:hypothetical protein
MSAYVAAFFGGILFSLFVGAVAAWRMTCVALPRLPDDCPHCDGTGMVVPAEDRPADLPTGPETPQENP